MKNDDLELPPELLGQSESDDEAFPSFDATQSSSVGYATPKPAAKLGCVAGCLLVVVALFGLGLLSNLRKDAPEKREAVESFAIDVESLNVKSIDGTYRYFFRIKNNDQKGFHGQVAIGLLSGWGIIPETEKGFETDKAVDPGRAQVVYIESPVGPKSRQRDKPIERFSFEVFIGRQSVAKGRKPITTKFERVD